VTLTVDENVSDAVKLAAIRDALDRAGLSARTAVSLEVGRRPFEVVFDDIVGGSRAESRRRRGIPDDDQLDVIERTHPIGLVSGSDTHPIVDAELAESEPDRTGLPAARTQSELAVPAAGPTRSVTSSGHNSGKEPLVREEITSSA
jgi:hypothetical protein